MKPAIQVVTPNSGTNLVAHLPDPENKKFYPALDGLRAVAVLLVFHQHYLVQPIEMRWGWTGVDIFFVLSGFLITGILYDTRHAKHRFRTFYARRSLRIFPLYYSLFLFGLITTPLFHWLWNGAWYLWLVYLGNFAQIDLFHWLLKKQEVFDVLRPTRFLSPYLTLTFGHFWSLCVEEQFYLVWPYVVYSIKDRVRLRNLCAAIVVIAPIIRLLCYFALPQKLVDDDFFYRFTPLRIDALLLGAFVALCLRGPEADRLVSIARPFLTVFLILFLFGTTASVLVAHHAISPDTRSPLVATIGFTCVDLVAASVLLLSLDPRNLIYRAEPFVAAASRSDELWLLRLSQAALYQLRRSYRMVLRSASASRQSCYGSIFIGTILVSYLSFRFFESKFLRLKNRFAP